MCVDLCGSLVCAEKKDFLQMEQRLGLCRRLMMNCAFIILLTHRNAASVVPVICFPVFFPSVLKKIFFFPVVLVALLGGGIKGGWDRSNKSRKKMAKRASVGVWGGVYYKVSSIRKASEWMYGRRVAASCL